MRQKVTKKENIYNLKRKHFKGNCKLTLQRSSFNAGEVGKKATTCLLCWVNHRTWRDMFWYVNASVLWSLCLNSNLYYDEKERFKCLKNTRIITPKIILHLKILPGMHHRCEDGISINNKILFNYAFHDDNVLFTLTMSDKLFFYF